MKIDISWLFNKQQKFLTPLQRLYPAFKLWWVSSAVMPKTLRLDILKFSKFLGARTEHTQTDKDLKRPVVWTLTELAIPQTLSYEPCITQHVFPAKKILQLPFKRWWLCTSQVHTISFPIPSHVEQHKDEPKLTLLCRNLFTACRHRDVMAQSDCAGPHFLISGHRQDVKSPIKLLKWLIFKWHFHPDQLRSVCQHQRAFASISFAPAPWCTSSVKVLQPPVAPTQVEHLNVAAHSSYMKQDLVKYFLFHSFLHLNLLTMNYWNLVLKTTQGRLRGAVHCKEINLLKKPQLVKLIKRLYRVKRVWEIH